MKGFIQQIVSLLPGGKYGKPCIRVNIPEWLKESLLKLEKKQEEGKGQLSRTDRIEELLNFISPEEISSIFQRNCVASVKLVYLQILLESYKNKVLQPKNNLECFVEFTVLGRTLHLGAHTVSKAVHYLYEQGVINIYRDPYEGLYCWQITL